MKFPLLKNPGFSGILLGILILAFSFGCQKSTFETGDISNPGSLTTSAVKAVNNNFIVITKSETLPAGFEAKLSAYGEIIRSMPEIGEIVVKPKVSGFESKVAKLTEVQAVVPDLKLRWIEPDEFPIEANPPSIGDDQALFWRQWGLDAIDAPEAWNAGHKGKDASVFILDTGIDPTHPDLQPNVNTALSISLIPGQTSYFDGNGHGTHVAGIIAAADNLPPNTGVIGVAPEAEIVAVKVLSDGGSGAFSWINAGIIYAANKGADVINMSLGATVFRNGYYYDDDEVLQKEPAVYIQQLILAQQRAVDYAFRKGVVIVTSAGNGGSNYDGNAFIFKLPAELNNVIAVSATAPYNWYYKYINNLANDLDIPASYTDYGKSLVELAAPGGDFDYPGDYRWDMVLSTVPGGWAWSAGTSMASPHVAGVAALIIGKNGGEMDPHEVTKQLFKTADKIDGNGTSAFYGNGRVNANRAVTE